MRAVIDSDVLVDYLQGSAEAFEELARYEQRCISLISWMEMMAGVRDGAGEATACRRSLSSFRVLPVTMAVAERAVGLRRMHRLKLLEAIIWASAQEAGCLLVTRNTKDSRRATRACAFLTGDKASGRQCDAPLPSPARRESVGLSPCGLHRGG